MVFDAIMGVGRTPQITKDVIKNPFEAAGADITNISNVTTNYNPTNISIVNGEFGNVINPYFDYVNNTALLVQYVTGGNGTFNYDFIMDIRRSFFIRKILFNYDYSLIAPDTDISITLSGSEDNTNYETYNTVTYTTGSGSAIDMQTFNRKARFVRIRISFINSGVTFGGNVTLNFARIVSSDLQEL